MKPKLDFKVRPVTDPTELPFCARIFDEALRESDSFYQVIEACSEHSVYEGALKALQTGFDDPSQYVFKAVRYEDAQEVVLGISHWSVGYINIPKVDPFADEASRSSPAVEENLVAPVCQYMPTED